MGLDFPTTHRFDLINWFCSSLRSNKNKLSHYLDHLKGCGHHLEEQAKENFFTIQRGLVKALKESNEEAEIKAILNALKWKYLARDHNKLRDLNIFKVIREGDQNMKDNKIKKAWGRKINQKVVEKDSEKNLTKEVIDVFQ